MSIPGTIARKLQELREGHSCKIGMNEPVQVSEGTLYAPFFDAPDGEAPDSSIPLFIMQPSGSVREVYGPSDEWFALLDQIPE